jgi:hypothetical protein
VNTKIVMHVGYPPESLVLMLRMYEATACEELKRELPNIQLLERLMEEIEGHADLLDIHLDWFDSKLGPSVRFSGECFGTYWMTDAVPIGL